MTEPIDGALHTAVATDQDDFWHEACVVAKTIKTKTDH